MKRAFIFILSMTLMLFLLVPANAESFGVRKKRPKPHEFGNIMINNFSSKSAIAPVIFPHWLHRARYTCRLCHVDIGFSMKTGETGINEEDNRNGIYCGACHDGSEAFGPTTTGDNGQISKNCLRCHSAGGNIEYKNRFYDFRKTMPRERFGNGIDWLKAEEEGKITPKDYLKNVSIKRAKIDDPADLTIAPEVKGMPEIVFSHRKHAKWNGCELCHPEIFGIKKGEQPYSMQEIFDGKYCGLCHGPVAFPNTDCQRCHTKMVQ